MVLVTDYLNQFAGDITASLTIVVLLVAIAQKQDNGTLGWSLRPPIFGLRAVSFT